MCCLLWVTDIETHPNRQIVCVSVQKLLLCECSGLCSVTEERRTTVMRDTLMIMMYWWWNTSNIPSSHRNSDITPNRVQTAFICSVFFSSVNFTVSTFLQCSGIMHRSIVGRKEGDGGDQEVMILRSETLLMVWIWTEVQYDVCVRRLYQSVMYVMSV